MAIEQQLVEQPVVIGVGPDLHREIPQLIVRRVVGVLDRDLHPMLAQQLARHSTITLTMDRYSHVGLLDMTAALASLPTISVPESQTMRATGTMDQEASDFGCTNSCTRPAEISRSQPISPVLMATEANSVKQRKNPHFSAKKQGFS